MEKMILAITSMVLLISQPIFADPGKRTYVGCHITENKISQKEVVDKPSCKNTVLKKGLREKSIEKDIVYADETLDIAFTEEWPITPAFPNSEKVHEAKDIVKGIEPEIIPKLEQRQEVLPQRQQQSASNEIFSFYKRHKEYYK
jgi:hypothetical protein